ncbi:MAG: FecR domain-containing protein [Candidatus Aminicenantes bacterium]
MIKKRFAIILAFALVCSLPQLLQSQSHYEYIHSPKTDIYFGHITYTEVEHDGNDPVVIREGEEAPRVAELNFPLLPGDTIRTTGSRRCEVQLDTGTIIRLDYNTELVIETIMAKSLSSFNKVTNFLLSKGEIFIMYKRYNYPEIFQVITPYASVKLKHRTVALIAAREDGGTDIQVKFGKAFVLYGLDEGSLMEEILKKSMRLTVSKTHRALQGEYIVDEEFELWNDSINKNFKELHEGMSVLPKPIYRYPRAVVYFAQKYSTLYGEWIWDDMYGYVWRCDYNDRYPWGTWQPYYYGQWREVDGQLFWVPMESWGWVPYHLGIWMWNKKRGWFWIPGSAFAPAWVSFHTWGDYWGWRPWSLWDWYLGGSYHRYPYYYLFNPGDPDSPLGPGWEEYLRREEIGIYKTRIHKRQLLNPDAAYPMSREFKGTLKKVVSALKRGDWRILASIRKNMEQTVVVKKGDVNEAGIHKRAVVFHKLPLHIQKSLQPTETIENPNREGVRIYRHDKSGVLQKEDALTGPGGKINKKGTPPAEAVRSITLNKKDSAEDKSRKVASDSQKSKAHFVSAIPVPGPRAKPRRSDRSITHFRDWNPDAGVARQVGVSLKYSSRTNEIKCPELGLSSRSVRPHRNMATMTGSSSVRSSGYSSSSSLSSSSRSSSSSSSRASSSSSSKSSGGGSSSRGSGGGSSRGSSKKK